MKINRHFFIAFLSIVSLASCSAKTVQPAPEIVVVNSLQPGVVRYVWEEPVVDVIDVPPGLDPDGIYYRPAHKEVVEVRQGRWQYYNGAEGNGPVPAATENVSK